MTYTIDNINNNKEVNYKLELSRDSFHAIALLVINLLYLPKFNIINLPRSETTLRFIEVLEDLGVKFSWNGYTDLKVRFNQLLSEDISHISNTNALNLFIPLILSKNSTVLINKENVKLAKKYHDFGFIVYDLENHFQISHPDVKQELDISYKAENIFDSYSYIMLNKIYNLNLEIENFNDNRIIAIQNLVKMYNESTNYPNTFDCMLNLTELELFSTLTLLRQGKIILKDHKINESLEFLLYLNNICSTYEVIDSSIRLWYQENTNMQSHFDFSKLAHTSLFFLIVLNLKYNKSFTAKIKLNEYTKAMFRLFSAYKIKVKRIEVVNEEVIVKFDNTLQTINTHVNVESFEDGIYAIVLANLINGTHKIDNLEKTLAGFIGLEQKLVDLGIKIKSV